MTVATVATRRAELEAEISEVRRSYPGIEVYRERAVYDAWNAANLERKKTRGNDLKVSAFHHLHQLKKKSLRMHYTL